MKAEALRKARLEAIKNYFRGRDCAACGEKIGGRFVEPINEMGDTMVVKVRCGGCARKVGSALVNFANDAQSKQYADYTTWGP